jgi:hypothetical protein
MSRQPGFCRFAGNLVVMFVGWEDFRLVGSAVTPDPGAVEGFGPPGIVVGPVGG